MYVIYCYLASLGTLLQGRAKVVLGELAAHCGRGMLGHDVRLDSLKAARAGSQRMTCVNLIVSQKKTK